MLITVPSMEGFGGIYNFLRMICALILFGEKKFRDIFSVKWTKKEQVPIQFYLDFIEDNSFGKVTYAIARLSGGLI